MQASAADEAFHADSVSEKITRGRLKSAAERDINRKTVVILDSLNNIKGYRCVKFIWHS